MKIHTAKLINTATVNGSGWMIRITRPGAVVFVRERDGQVMRFQTTRLADEFMANVRSGIDPGFISAVTPYDPAAVDK